MKPNNHYYTSDLHLGHKNILIFDPRPFDDIEEHDATITANMRPESRDAKRKNELWILGDVAFGENRLFKFMSEIRPHWEKIHLIRGNHDDRIAWAHRDLFDSAQEAFYQHVDKKNRLYLSHYAHRVWRNSCHGSMHVHGHSHGNLPPWGKSVDVSINAHDYRPASLRRIVELTGGGEKINHH